jgi:hypothetical protein
MDEAGRIGAPLLIAGVLLAMGIAYVLLLAQPGLVHGVGRLWSFLPEAARAPSWALPAVAAGVAIGGAGLGVLALAAFVRGVQRHPYAWLAPVLVGFSTLVMTGMAIELPWPAISVRAFSVLAGLTLIGGGAVMQMRGGASKTAGVLLLLLPMVTLLAGYAAMPAGLPAMLARLDASGQLFLFVLSLTSIGIGFTALVTRRELDSATLLAAHMRDQRLHAADALERVRASEARAAEAERRAQLAEHHLRVQFGGQAVSDVEAAEFAALARPGMSSRMLAALAVLGLIAVGAGLYFGVYRGVARRAEVQQALIAERAKEHAEEIEALRKRFTAQQAALEVQMAAERSRTAEALSEAEPRRAAATAEPPPVAEAAPVAAEPVKAPARARKSPARRAARKSASAAAVPSEDGLDRATRRALRESVNDDPIGGLD